MQLARHGRPLLARYVLRDVPRGRYRFEAVRAIFEDPFALARAELHLGTESALLVYPRLVDLDRLFTQSGGAMLSGGRVLLRRTAGFDLHSVREYEQGESLRKVHWRTTARRGTLMVKELEDMPHDEVAVLLDADEHAVVGESFDVQVRAAGSILRAHALAGRRSLLTVTVLAAGVVPRARRSTASGGLLSSCSRAPSRQAPSRSRASSTGTRRPPARPPSWSSSRAPSTRS